MIMAYIFKLTVNNHSILILGINVIILMLYCLKCEKTNQSYGPLYLFIFVQISELYSVYISQAFHCHNSMIDKNHINNSNFIMSTTSMGFSKRGQYII